MTKKPTKISRRKFLPAFTGLLLTPFISTKAKNLTEDTEYKTLIKKDGTAVRIKIASLKKAKTIERNISNQSLLQWLGKK